MRPKKGDVLRYTGGYEPGITPYGPGRVVAFRNYKTVVTVELLDEPGSYADWPVDEVEKVAT